MDVDGVKVAGASEEQLFRLQVKCSIKRKSHSVSAFVSCEFRGHTNM